MRNRVSLVWGNEISTVITKETRFLGLVNWCSRLKIELIQYVSQCSLNDNLTITKAIPVFHEVMYSSFFASNKVENQEKIIFFL